MVAVLVQISVDAVTALLCPVSPFRPVLSVVAISTNGFTSGTAVLDSYDSADVGDGT